jgi:hypothetical protein
MKSFSILFLLLISTFSYAQIKYEVQDFSKDYYGAVYVTDTSDFFKKGWISIYDKKSDSELIKVESDAIVLEILDGMLIVIVNEFPGEDVIAYDDFNFDGVNDFAISDGHSGSYGMPTYKIYLAENSKFVYNEIFTELGQDYLGMFSVDHEKKIISAEQKSGCCYHENSEFIVENNAPKLVLKITEDATKGDEYVYITTEKYIDGKWTKTTKKEKIEEYYK